MQTSEITIEGQRFARVEFYNQFRVPDEGEYLRVLWDHETDEYDHKPRTGLGPNRKPMPATVALWGCKPDDFIPLAEPAQRFWYGLLEKIAQGALSKKQLEDVWVDMTLNRRALTDNHAAFQADENGDPIPIPGGFADYIMGVNLENPKPIAIKCLDMAGNILKIIRKDAQYYYFETLDLFDFPAVEEAWGKWWLIHWCTETTAQELPRTGRDRNWAVGRWPQFELFSDLKFGVPFPLVGPGGVNRVRKNRVTQIANGTWYSPYNPSTA